MNLTKADLKFSLYVLIAFLIFACLALLVAWWPSWLLVWPGWLLGPIGYPPGHTSCDCRLTDDACWNQCRELYWDREAAYATFYAAQQTPPAWWPWKAATATP